MARNDLGDEGGNMVSRDRRHTLSTDAADALGHPDTARTDMLHAIDGQLAELNHMIGAHHTGGAEPTQSALLTEAANNLAVLRGQVETARNSVQLAALRVTMSGAAQGASTAMASATFSTSSQQQLAAKLYDTRMTAAERGMADISRRDDILFSSAEHRADEMGIDVGFFRNQRSLLEAEANAARKRGDRFGAIVPEGLLAHNTANLLDDIADRTGFPEDRRKAEEGRKLAEEADRKVREAAQAEAERGAASRHFTSEGDRERWIADDAGRRYHQYEDRVDSLHPSGPQHDKRRAKLATRNAAFTDGLDTALVAQPEQAEGGLAALLPASARDAAREAGRIVSQDTSRAGADDEPKLPAASPVNVAAARSAPGSSVTL